MLLIQPSDEMSKLIRKELNENVDTREKDLEIIKEWLTKQPHLPGFDGNFKVLIDYNFSNQLGIDTCKFSDDQRIMTFLRGCKFSLEKCKRKIDMYFTMRALVPEFFSNRDIKSPELQEVARVL